MQWGLSAELGDGGWRGTLSPSTTKLHIGENSLPKGIAPRLGEVESLGEWKKRTRAGGEKGTRGGEKDGLGGRDQGLVVVVVAGKGVRAGSR